jgi:hypothetical protein
MSKEWTKIGFVERKLGVGISFRVQPGVEDY